MNSRVFNQFVFNSNLDFYYFAIKLLLFLIINCWKSGQSDQSNRLQWGGKSLYPIESSADRKVNGRRKSVAYSQLTCPAEPKRPFWLIFCSNRNGMKCCSSWSFYQTAADGRMNALQREKSAPTHCPAPTAPIKNKLKLCFPTLKHGIYVNNDANPFVQKKKQGEVANVVWSELCECSSCSILCKKLCYGTRIGLCPDKQSYWFSVTMQHLNQFR